MKKLTVMLLAVLLLCVPCMTAFAAAPEQKGATISTTVPATHTITFISDGGRIEESSNDLDGTEEFDRRSVHTFHIIPDEGKEIDKVLFGGEDVTSQIRDGYFTTPPLIADMTFEVIYKDAATPVEPVSEPTSEPTKPDTSKPDSSKPDSSKPDSSKPDTSTPEQSGSTDTSTPHSSDSSDTAKTGDTTMTIVFVIATVTTVSAVFIIVLAKSRRKEKNGN